MPATAAAPDMLLFVLAAETSADQAWFWSYVFDVLVLLGGAMLLGALAERLRQSAIVGYLLAGTLLGPVLGVVQNREAMLTIAELGVALLLFSIGLEFSWGRLRSLGFKALLAGVLQITVTLSLGAGVAMALGQPLSAAVAIGAMVALSSTAVVLRTLVDRGEIDSIHGRGALGVLLVQDVAVVPLVLLVQTLGTGTGGVGDVAVGLGKEVVLAAGLIAAFVVLAKYVLPRVMRHPSISKNRELPILFAIVTAIGSSWAAYAVGLSPALGAFVAGVILGGSPLATSIRADVGPLKTLFVTLFFSAIGMLADLEWIAGHIVLGATVLAAVIVGNALIVTALLKALRYTTRHAVATGLALANIGEFSFVLATIALSARAFDQDVFALMVSATIGSLFLTPYLINYAVPIGAWTERKVRRRRAASAPAGGVGDADEADHKLTGHVVVIGFGPAGRVVAERLARRDDAPPVMVVDLNPRSVLEARSEGLHALVGDAGSAEIIEEAHVPQARAVVVTLPDHRAAITTIERVRAFCPRVPIVARARYHIYVDALYAAGAQAVVDEESSVGAKLSSAVDEVL